MTRPDFSERLSSLRREIENAGADGFILPRTDEYQSEYIAPYAERIAYLSGFTGSAGAIAVLKDKAALFVDGRYTLQAARQIDPNLFSVFNTAEKTSLAWLKENAKKDEKIAYDPWQFSAEGLERLRASLSDAGATAIPAKHNFVDVIWEDQPETPATKAEIHDLIFSGKTSEEKRQTLAADLKKKNLDAAVIADPASVAWLLNVRGNDVAYTPLSLSRAILMADGSAQWFVDERKISEPLLEHLGDQISVLPPAQFAEALEALAREGKTVFVDTAQTPSWVVETLIAFQGKIECGEDLCALPRAIKNAAELNGMRAAHVRDGAALTGFFAWLSDAWKNGRVTENNAAQKLEDFRQGNALYQGPSFETISASGEHGAIVHYHAEPESEALLLGGHLYLVDSGGQYLDGTTDVTRTIALGDPTPEMRENFTRVLKGHIALASIRFPEGTTGSDIDVLARQYLWEAGRDYSHGTGHGVGCYLGVHEGPQSISRRNKVPLRPGMILSNEPGYYKEGAYGIRIENLMAVVEIAGIPGVEQKTLGFDMLTLAPLDRTLIERSMLTEPERKWINSYHRRVCKSLCGMLGEEARAWLERATAPID